jgi:hypothetical protein
LNRHGFVEGLRNGRSPQLFEAGVVSLFSRLRQSFAATKLRRKGCLFSLAGAFVLAAAVVWFVQLFGPITACLFFSGAFILIGLSVGSVSRAKEKEASERLESAKRGVTQNVHAVMPKDEGFKRAISLPDPALPFGNQLDWLRVAPSNNEHWATAPVDWSFFFGTSTSYASFSSPIDWGCRLKHHADQRGMTAMTAGTFAEICL